MAETQIVSEKNKKSFFSSSKYIQRLSLDSLSATILFWGILLLPLFFLPALDLSLDAGKTLFFIAIIIISFFLWLFARLKGGSITVPLHPLLVSAAVVALVFFISALFSPSLQQSLSGFMYETGTAVFIFAGFLLFFLSTLFFQTSRAVEAFYKSFLVIFAVVFLAWVLRMVVGDAFSLGALFQEKTGNLVGKWNDLAVFSGFIALLSLVALEKAALSKQTKGVLCGALFASLVLLAIVNFYLVWVVVGLFALVMFVHHFSSARFQKNQPVKSALSYPSGIVLLVSLVFVIMGGTLGGFINETLGITQIEVRPSWVSTGTVLKETIKEDPLLGSGPNRFTNQWFRFKPDSINASPFWNTEFRSGVGIFPTFAVTSGVLGAVSWSVFLLLFIYHGLRSFFVAEMTRTRYAVFSSFVLALYLWIIAFFYVPGITLFALAFLMTGLFVGVSVESGRIKQFTFSYFENPRAGFVSVLVLVLLLIGTTVTSYAFVKKIVALKHFHASRVAFGAGDTNTADERIKKAIRHNNIGAYYRGLAEVKTRQISELLSRNDLTPEAARAEFQALLGEAINAGQQATRLDETQYVNWLSLARVYASVTPFVSGAYESARVSLTEALSRNPKSPLLLLEHARLELANKNTQEARRYIAESLQVKPDYADAIFLLAQIEFSEGNVSAAIASVQGAAFAAPNNDGLFFQLGLLKYNTRDYAGAAEALLRAVQLNPEFANAKYFLGLSLYNIDRTAEAIVQFEDLGRANPDNEEVKLILENVKAGRGPFANFDAPDFSERNAPPL